MRPVMGESVFALEFPAREIGELANRFVPLDETRLLEIGALSALIAAGVQAFGARAVRELSTAGAPDGFRSTNRAVAGQRIAAALLAVTVICMAAARYA